MSGRKTSKPTAGGMPEEGEEFMALLMAAQRSDSCDCIFGRYFKKMGDQMLSKYVDEE